MSVKLDIIWELNEDINMQMYHEASKNILNSFYQNKRFYVLPFLPEKFRTRVVYFPRVNEYISDFDIFAKLDDYRSIPSNVNKAITSSYQKYTPHYTKRFLQLENQSDNIQSKFEKFISIQYAGVKYNPIRIQPRYVGSVGTYHIRSDSINLFPRFDRNLSEIYALIIGAIVQQDLFIRGQISSVDWRELSEKEWWIKQQASLEIIKSKSFKALFSEVKGMTDTLYQNSAGGLAKQSSDYLELMGYGLTPFIKSPKDILNLTKEEERVLLLLIANRNKIITYDQLAAIMWGENNANKFSLYAISKVIERLRHKIKNSNIGPNLIHAYRGEGYLFYD